MAEVSYEDVGAVIARLEGRQFTRRRQIEPGGFGDRLEEWDNGRSHVRLVRDRGQWFIDIAIGDSDDWFDVDLVSHVIDSREDTTLGRVEAAVSTDLDHLLPALRAAREAHARHRLGWLSPRHPYS